MVEPISIMAAICGVITACHALYQWYHHYQAKRLAMKTSQNTATENELLKGFVNIWTRYNRIASTLGGKFELGFNGSLTLLSFATCEC
jgi:hypothetical protein